MRVNSFCFTLLSPHIYLHYLHVQEPKETASKAKAHRVVDLGLILQSRIIQLELAQGLAEVLGSA